MKLWDQVSSQFLSQCLVIYVLHLLILVLCIFIVNNFIIILSALFCFFSSTISTFLSLSFKMDYITLDTG